MAAEACGFASKGGGRKSAGLSVLTVASRALGCLSWRLLLKKRLRFLQQCDSLLFCDRLDH